VAPPDRSHILKLDIKGNILEKWASFGNYDGQLFWGHDIAVGNDGQFTSATSLEGVCRSFFRDKSRNPSCS
jgi:hypothetical protein